MSKFDFSPEEIDKKLKELKSQSTRISLLRIIVFFGLIGTGVLFLSEHPLWGLGLAFLGWAFVRLINTYNFQKDQEAIYLALLKLEEEVKNQKLRKLGELETGAEFLDKKHPFANDLDLFGEHSLFQLVNQTVSKAGRKKLAEEMKSSFDLNAAKFKRDAIDELSEKKEFLGAMTSIGKAFYQEGNRSGWQGWLSDTEKLKTWIWPFAILGPLGGVVLSTLVYIGMVPASALGIWILLGMIFLGVVFQSLKKAGDEIPSREELKTYRYWLEVLENQSFQSKSLKVALAPLEIDSEKAHKLLADLDSFGLWVQNRINILYIPLNFLFWTDLILYLRLIGWKNKYGKQLSSFPEALSTWEVLYSLGMFQAELGAKGQVLAIENGIEGVEISHPLLMPGVAIPNDFSQSLEDQVILLTGANMSGKTTFMRTLGINCVLTNLGLRPFAKSFGFGDLQLYTSMRNSDNLGESVSSFYAELSRIKKLIDRAEGGEKIYFLLDEILKGTNTEDRIAGSEALIQQVLETKAMGIISTHDIELAELDQKVAAVRNYSFHSEVLDQTINFDYKIKNGPCPSFNAHKLMELMGIRFRG